MNNDIKGLVIDKSDYKELKELVDNALFQAGLYALSGDTLYPKKDSYAKLEAIIMYGCQQSSNTHSFVESVKALYGDSRVESAISRSMIRDSIVGTPKTLYSIVTSRAYKVLGDFI